MAADVPEEELLFFDTFSHENAEELNLDLVQFPSPVIISEVRIIPLQTRVQADVPGGVRLGATNPANFKLELFVNNLSKPNSSVFERLGLLDYVANREILHKSEKEIPTDGLILKGWYNTITVAIYGQLTIVKADRSSPPPPPPPQPKAKPQTVEARSSQQSEPTRQEWEPPRQATAKPQQQHPLDYIQQQVELQQHQQKQQQQQAHAQIPPQGVPHPMTHPPPQPVPPPIPPHPLTHPPPQQVPPPLPHILSQPPPKVVPGQQPPELFRNVDPVFDPTRPPPSTVRHIDSRDPHFEPPTLTREGTREFPPSDSRDQYDAGEDRQRDSYDRDFRSHRDTDSRDREFDRSREGSRDGSRDRDMREVAGRVNKEKERREREWEKFREREREREAMKEKNRDYPLSPSRSWSRSRSRSRSYSRSPRRKRSRSRSSSRSPDRRSWSPGRRSRSPGRRSRSPPSLRSRSPPSLKSRSPPSIRSRSPSSRRSRTPPRRSFSPTEMHQISPGPPQLHPRSPVITPRSPVLQTPMSPESRSMSQEPEMIEPIITQRSDVPSHHEPQILPGEDEETEAGEIIEGEPEFEPMSPDQSPYMSDGEIQDVDDAYENISSDDEFPEMEDISNLEDIEDIPEDWSYTVPTFNPLQSEITPLTSFKDISLTRYEVEKEELLQNVEKHTQRPTEAQTLVDIVEEFSNASHHDRWIEALEGVPALLSKGLVYLIYKEKRTDILDTLIDWTLEGLDTDKAISQPESAYKVRHLKMGIKLAGSLGCCDQDITVKLLSKNIQHKLLDLFTDQFMSFSLKLQILLSLDKTTRFKDGLEWFLGRHSLQKSEIKQEDVKPPTEEVSETCYKRFITAMLKKQVVRASVAMTALLRKIHIYEVMIKLSHKVDSVMESTQLSLSEASHSKSHDDSGSSEVDDEAAMLGVQTIADSEAESIVTALSEVTKVITLAPHILAQPKRTLPGKMMFEVTTPPYDPYPNLFHLAHSCGLLESLFVLLSSPSASSHMAIFSAVKSLLETLVKTQNGLLFLTSKPDLTNGIMKSLIQAPDFNKEEAVDESPLQHLGMELINYLHSFLFVDQLLSFQSKVKKENKKELESERSLTLLRNLLSITFTPAGKEAVVHVLGLEDNLTAILPFLERTGDDEGVVNLKKSVCAGYSVGLLLCLVRHTQTVIPFEKFSKRLVTISEDDFSSRLSELQEWLSPLKSLTQYNHEGVSAAVTQLKHLGEDLQKIPRSLVTVIRVLKDMTVPPENKYPDEAPVELKYKYALLEVYGADCFPVLTNVLQKTCELLLRSWQEGIAQSGDQMAYHISIVKPTLEIVKAILLHLILARGAEFKDLTALPVLFEVYTIFCSVPMSSLFTDDLMEIQKHIIDTLVAYTQPNLSQSETEEALSQSLWTLLLKELFKYTLKAPYTYLSGLLMLSELLPLPLPLQAKEALSTEEINLAINTRKLWSAHLHPLVSQVQEVIQKLGMSTCQPLQQVLRRICWQLSDLSAPSAVMVTKTVVNMVMESLVGMKRVEERKEGEEQKEEIPNMIASPYASKMLNLLAFVVQQPAIKCAMLQLASKTEGEEMYAELIPNLLEILNTVCDTVPHIQAQECVVSIIQSLCDLEVAMVTGESVPISDQIAFSLPPGDYMTQITSALLDHMCNPDHSYASILPCVRTLVMLTDHDYGFYCLKTALEQKTTVLGSLMVRINTTFSKDSSDCLSTLSTLLEFLRLLVSVDVPGMEVNITRTYTLSTKELQEVLSWKPSMENHPLFDLEKLLEECAKDDETLESLLDSMVNLMKTLREATGKDTPKSVISEPSLPPPKSLSDLFGSRTVYVISNTEDEHLNATYWLANPVTDEADIEPALIAVDMEDICRRYMPDFNLEEELKKSKSSTDEFSIKPRRIKHGDRRASKEININRGRGFRRPFVAPMRGRGIARGLMNNANRIDNFRSRPPNTSRPPSMHVDDFMKLEKGQNEQQDTPGPPPPGMIRRGDKDMDRGRGRGRGFDRGRGFGQGRFFTPPGNYNRRDSGGRGGMNMYNRPKFDSPHSFGRGDMRPGSEERRGERDFNFQPRGRGYWPRGKDDRFMGRGFRGRRDDGDRGRHLRSFTK